MGVYSRVGCICQKHPMGGDLFEGGLIKGGLNQRRGLNRVFTVLAITRKYGDVL